MKKVKLLLFAVFFLVEFSQAQTDTSHFLANDTIESGKEDQWRKSLKTRNYGLITLGAWAVGNMLLSGGLYFRPQQASSKRFHQMNVLWNTVNLSLALSGLHSTNQLTKQELSLKERYENHLQLEKILLFNAGLDIGYVATGFYLLERSQRGGKYEAHFRGYGRSLIMQGAFLFVFDLAFYYAMNKALPPDWLLGLH